MTLVRPAAVAGSFYPGRAQTLAATVAELLADAAARLPADAAAAPPKAIVAPHAGYVYSGPIAASAYARLKPHAATIRRVVLLGPCHRVPLRGLAVPTVDAFETPLGCVPIDRAAVEALLALPQVMAYDACHAEEHALEVHLPFLQVMLERFTLVPLVVGDAGDESVADVLAHVWGGPETLIVVSSDLSHYRDYAAAQRSDAATRRAIERLDPAAIDPDQACGRAPLGGLLTLAKRRGLAVATLDVRNSGDTAGDRRRVVGYGAWMFTEPEPPRRRVGSEGHGDAAEGSASAATRALLDRHGPTLLHLAAASIDHGLRYGRALPTTAADHAVELRAEGASFVTLHGAGKLRGCVGSSRAHRPLVEDVAGNAFAAAFRDDRFAKLKADERRTLAISVSLLSRPQPLAVGCDAELIDALRPYQDGLIIESRGRRALFLPQVWTQIDEPHAFVNHLKAKAGLARDHWSDDTRAWRFTTESIGSDTIGGSEALWSR